MLSIPQPLSRLWIPIFAVFTLHNLEELIGIQRDWPARHIGRMQWTSGRWPEFALVLTVLTAAGIGIAYAVRKNERVTGQLMMLFLSVMLLNVLWHIGVSVYAGALAPGVLTACLAILPYYSLLLVRLARSRDKTA